MWKSDCEMRGYTRQELNSDLDVALHASDRQLSLMIICISYAVICTLGLGTIKVVCFLFMCVKNKDLSKKFMYRFNVFALTKVIIALGFCALKLTYFILCLNSVNRYLDIFENIGTLDCSDDVQNRAFGEFVDIFISGRSKNKTGLILTCVSILLNAMQASTLYSFFWAK